MRSQILFFTWALLGLGCGAQAPIPRENTEKPAGTSLSPAGTSAGTPSLTTAEAPASAAPVTPIRGLQEAIRVGVGSGHACALLRSGQVACWGANAGAQLGTTDLRDRRNPALVTGISDATSLSVFEEHACVVRKSGEIACWGAGVPEPGGEAAEIVNPPQVIPGISKAKEIVTDATHTCVVRQNDQVACFGENAMGELGDTKATGSRGVRDIPRTSGTVGIALSRHGGCAVRTTGKLQCWGAGAITAWAPGGAKMVFPKFDDAVSPREIVGVSEVQSVDLWDLRACAVRKTGKVTCWNIESFSIATGAEQGTWEGTDVEDAIRVAGDLVLRRSGSIARIAEPGGSDSEVGGPALSEIRGAVDVAGTWMSGCAALGSGEVVCWGDAAALSAPIE